MNDLTASAYKALRPALMAAWWTFLAIFGLTITGWLGDVAEWASASGTTGFPSLSVLGYGAVSAAAAAASGVVAFVVRTAQGYTGTGHPPSYT